MKQIYLVLTLALSYLGLTAQSGNSLNLDGTDDVVSITNVTTATFTLEATIKVLSPSPTGVMAYEGAGILDSDVGGDAFDFIFSVLNDKLCFWDGSSYINIAGNTNVVDGNWHHVAVVREANVSLRLYVDGVLDAEIFGVDTTVLNDNPNIYIGAAYVDSRFLNTDIDEVRIWNYARSINEIDHYKGCELTGNESGLVSYYQFNQGVANADNAAITTLIDNSPNGNDGTLMNFTLDSSASNWTDTSAITTGDTCATLSLNTITGNNTQYVLFPNPSSDFIEIQGLSKTERYALYNMLGHKLNLGLTMKGDKIDIRHLSNGLYFLKFTNGDTIKFIKE
ncbi:LamG-like jellyroll fold domain-containing protein [Confluentibacter lentus]|uniref:LamG-like jellyroll fold domain-containing protein n=1 Tax=Confluentibacter lentus TaxID=1699412 RepID=UPI000C2870BA|nr:LamG-like jellyroll fold domain-containing protein [Confluentibacter lentus]